MKLCLILICALFFIIPTTAFAANPTISDISPSDNSTITLDNGKVYLKANITDADGDLTYVAFETNATGNWTKILEATFVGNWTTTSPATLSGLEQNKKYYWRIEAKDTQGNWTNSSVFTFTTNWGSEGGTINIIPSQPKAKKSIIFIAGNNDAMGYVLCYETGDVYLLELKKGVGMVTLDIEYGSAVVYIVGYGSKSFTIESPYSGSLQINAPSDIEIDTATDISVTAQGEMINANMEITSPTNRKTTRITGTNPIQVTFNEVGIWTLAANIYDTTTSRTIEITPKPIQITVPDEIKLGEEGTITTNPGVNVTIQKGEISWMYTADDNGQVFFTPEWTGRYKIIATAFGEAGAKYFNVVTETTISIKNENSETVNTIKKGDILFIQIMDSKSQTVTGTSDLVIYGDQSEITTLPIVNGIAIWHVTTDAYSYDFNYDSNDVLYLSANLNIPGNYLIQQPVDIIWYIVGGIIAIVVVVLLFLQWKGYIDLHIFRKEEEPLL